MFPVTSSVGQPAGLDGHTSRNQSSSRSVETRIQSAATGGAAIVIDNQLVAADGTIPENIRNLPRAAESDPPPASKVRPAPVSASSANSRAQVRPTAIPVRSSHSFSLPRIGNGPPASKVRPAPVPASSSQVRPTAIPVRSSHSFSLPRIGNGRPKVAPTLTPAQPDLTVREVRLPDFEVSKPKEVKDIDTGPGIISAEKPSSEKVSNEESSAGTDSDLRLQSHDTEEKVSSLLRRLSTSPGSLLVTLKTPTSSFFVDA